MYNLPVEQLPCVPQFTVLLGRYYVRSKAGVAKFTVTILVMSPPSRLHCWLAYGHEPQQVHTYAYLISL